MNKLIFCVKKVVDKTIHKLITEPIGKALLGSHGKNIHIGKCVQGNLENVKVGNNVSIGANNTFLSSKAKIIIGDNVMFGPGVTMITGDHRTDIVGKAMIAVKDEEKLTKNDQDIHFQGDNWIGANATILKGVTIGEGAIVAACSLVISDVEPYTIVGGIPAREIKKRFTDEQLEKHLSLIKEEWRR